MIPLPCNPESISIGYALRNGTQIAPVTGMLPREVLVDAVPNTVSFEKYPGLRDLHLRILQPGIRPDQTPPRGSRRCSAACQRCPRPRTLQYKDIFRVAIMEFLDPHNFTIGRVKRS